MQAMQQRPSRTMNEQNKSCPENQCRRSAEPAAGAAIGARDERSHPEGPAEALRSALQRLDAHILNSPLAIVEFDSTFCIIRWSAEAERLFGWKADEILGKRIGEWQWVHEDDLDAVTRISAQMLAGKQSRNMHANRNYRKDGSVVHCEWYNSAIYDQEGRLSSILSLVLDVTERKRTEQALRESEERFRGMTQAVPSMTFEGDPQGNNTFSSEQWCRYTGMTAEETAGMGWARAVHPDDLAASAAGWTKAMNAGVPVEMRHRLRAADGSYRWFMMQSVPLRDSAGRIVRWAGSLTDIHDLIEAKAAAERASRAKDQFIAMLSHELRTPLNPAMLATSLLAQNLDLPESLQEDVQIIRRSLELEAQLIDDLLDLNRISRGKIILTRRIVDASEVLQQAMATCDTELHEKGLILHVEQLASAAMVDADPGRLQQVFWNLLKNAVKFTPAGGQIRVRLQTRGDASAGGKAVIEVKDTGIGINSETLGRIFGAFEQGSIEARRAGGLGLGLAISRSLVELHGGTIQAHSDGLGKGATFTVELPLVSRPVHAGPATTFSNHIPAGTTHSNGKLAILFVEDHEMTARMTARLLRGEGHEVAVAASVAEAIRAADGRTFDLLLCDLGLPDGTGHDVMRHLRKTSPIRAIALSGFGMENDLARSRQAGFLAHLVKPINVQQLLEAIDSAIHSAI